MMVGHSFSARAVIFVTGRTTAAGEKNFCALTDLVLPNYANCESATLCRVTRCKRRIMCRAFSFYHRCNVFSPSWV